MSELEALRVREEVLQAMYWMRSEGLAERSSAAELASFLAVPAPVLGGFLVRFAEEGYLDSEGDRFWLEPQGGGGRQALLRRRVRGSDSTHPRRV